MLSGRSTIELYRRLMNLLFMHCTGLHWRTFAVSELENKSKLFGGDFFSSVVNVFISMEFRFESRIKFLFKEKCCLQSCIKSAVQRSEGFRVGVLTFRPSSINLIIFSRIPESLFGCSALAIE